GYGETPSTGRYAASGRPPAPPHPFPLRIYPVPTFPAATLETFAASLFRASGVPDADAAQVAHSLVLANLCGHDSHGLIRIPQYLDAVGDGRLKPGAAFTVVKETPAMLVADGGRGFGQVQAHRLLQRIIPMARNVG